MPGSCARDLQCITLNSQTRERLLKIRQRVFAKNGIMLNNSAVMRLALMLVEAIDVSDAAIVALQAEDRRRRKPNRYDDKMS